MTSYDYEIMKKNSAQIQVNKNDIRWMKDNLRSQTKLLYALIISILGGFGTLIATILTVYNSILKELI